MKIDHEKMAVAWAHAGAVSLLPLAYAWLSVNGPEWIRPTKDSHGFVDSDPLLISALLCGFFLLSKAAYLAAHSFSE